MNSRGRATTLVELMVVLAIWSGLMVLILGFYVQATEITRRHDRISDQFRKIHEIHEVVEGLLSRSKLYYLSSGPMQVVFARPTAEPISSYGQPTWQDAETLALEPTPDDTSPPSMRFPLKGQLVLQSLNSRRVLVKLDLASFVEIKKPDEPPPGGEYVLQVDIGIPVPGQNLGPIKSIDDLKPEQRKVYTRFVMLENSSTAEVLNELKPAPTP